MVYYGAGMDVDNISTPPAAVDTALEQLIDALDTLGELHNEQLKQAYLAAHPDSQTNPTSAYLCWLNYAISQGYET